MTLYYYYAEQKIYGKVENETSWEDFSATRPKLTQATKAEYDAYILETETFPMISGENTYQSAHKNAENNTLNLLRTQHQEISTTLLLQIMDGRVPSDYTATIVKLRNLETYSIQLAVIAVERQAYIKAQMEQGVEASVAEAAALKTIKITDITALVGKHLHEQYVNSKLTTAVVDKYKQDTIDVNYSTHLSEDEANNELT